MPSRVNHVAIASDHYAINGRFYELLFGMKTSSKPRPARSVVLGDGYVGMNCIPRRDGRYSGLDHFGIEVDDLEDTIARIKRFDPSLSAVKRPPIRPFAAYSAHDPDTNIFDLSGPSMDKKDVYAENNWSGKRRISHIALRTRHAERCAQFYVEVFGLKPLNRTDDNWYLSDGRMVLMIIPWRIADYYAQDPARTGLDHIGFEVEFGRAGEEGHGVPDWGEPAHARPGVGVWVGGGGAAEIISEVPARVLPFDGHRGRAHRCRGSFAVASHNSRSHGVLGDGL